MKQDGFALVVIAVLFTALSVIAAAMIDRQNVLHPIQQAKESHALAAKINMALVSYANQHHSLPEPINGRPAADGFVTGELPAAALGIDSSQTIQYTVNQALIDGTHVSNYRTVRATLADVVIVIPLGNEIKPIRISSQDGLIH